MRYLYIFLLPFFIIGCTSQLSEKIRNQENCALLSGDKLKIIDGNIIKLPNKELMGEIFSIDSNHIKIIDDVKAEKVFTLKVFSKQSNKKLLAVMWDEKNILMACGID